MRRAKFFWSRAAEEITGHLRHEVIGHHFSNGVLMYCDQEGGILLPEEYPLTQTMHDGKTRSLDVFLQHKTGCQIPVTVTSFPVADENGVILGAAETFEEKHATQEWVEREKEFATHGCLDEVSGLPNRAYTQSYLETCMAMYARHRLAFGVLCLQVDDLKRFRDIHGAGAVHALLRVVSGTIRHALGNGAHVGRWTEDRFLIVILGYRPYGLTKIAQDLGRIVSRSTIQWWGDVLSIAVSLGAAEVYEAESLDRLIEEAEKSMRKISHGGGEQANAAHV